MKSAYFIAQPKNMGRFNDLFESESVFPTEYNADNIPSLTAFVQRDKSIATQDYVCIDVGPVRMWSISHILSAVQLLRRFSSAQLIFIGEPCEDLTELYGALASVHHVDCLITERGNGTTTEELQKCLAGKMAMPERMAAITQMMAKQAGEITKPLTIPPGLVIEVALAGTMSRCGATTQLFQLYHYLKSLGWHPAIWDKLGQLLPLLMRYEVYRESENGVTTIRDIDFVKTEMPQYNAYLIDYGVLTAEKVPLFRKADLSVLVGCTKPWELPAFAEAVKLLFGVPCSQMVTLASFATAADLDALVGYLGDHTGIAPYAPDWWRSAEDMGAYKTLVLPALKEICGPENQTHTPELEVGG